MPHELLVEVQTPDGRWQATGSIKAGMAPGSIADEGPVGRQMYVFGWIEGRVGVYRSVAGVDYGNDAFRAVTSLELSLVSDLSEPCELVVHRPSVGAIRTRFSLIPGGGR